MWISRRPVQCQTALATDLERATERGGDDTARAHFPLLHAHDRIPAVLAIKVAMMREDAALHGGGEFAQAAEIVVTISLNVPDAERGGHGEILEQCDGAEIGEILPAKMELARSGAAAPGDERGIGDAAEDPFAVLVAGAGIAPGERCLQRMKVALGFVDDDRRPGVPGEEIGGRFRRERGVAMQRLLDEDEAAEKARDQRIGEQLLPQRAEGSDGAKVLVSVQREGAARPDAAEQAGELMKTRAVVFEVAAEFDFEMGEPVGADAIFERLRLAVIHPFVGGDLRSGEWIGEPHGVTGNDRLERRGRKEIARLAADLRMNRREADPERIGSHRASERLAPRAAPRINDRALHERHPEPGQQRRPPPLGGGEFLRGRNLLPKCKDRSRCVRGASVCARSVNDLLHLRDLFSERSRWILREPFRRQIIRGESHRGRTVDFNLQPQDEVRHVRHGGDAILEGHAQVQFADIEMGGGDSEAHERTTMAERPVESAPKRDHAQSRSSRNRPNIAPRPPSRYGERCIKPVTIQQAFELALQHHQSGQLPEAEALYRQILAVEPRHAEALHLLGVLAHQVGRHDLAIELIREAIALAPGTAEFHSNLGEAYRGAGHLDQAIAEYRHAIALNPNYPEAHSNLGNALTKMGHLDEAAAAARQAIALNPQLAVAYHNLGNALYGTGQFDQATDAFRQTIALQPNKPEAYNNLGNALKKQGQLDEAIAAFHQAMALDPKIPDIHSNLSTALKDKGQVNEAISAAREAITLKPKFPEAYNNLGAALDSNGDHNAAIVAYRQAIALNPSYSEAYSNLGNALNSAGFPDEAVAAYRQSMVLKPDFPEAHSNLLLTLNYLPACNDRALAVERQRWNQQHAEPLRHFIQPHPNERITDRRLRVGYVSSDFREHSVAYFVEGLLAAHDPTQVEVFCYASVTWPDAVTARLRKLAAHWQNIVGMPDAAVADLIREDRIDILVDLAGHTAQHRLLVFARKPTPVQVTWLGYPGSTGVQTIDYRLTDALADPLATDDFLPAERLIRLPHCAWCFLPSAAAPPVTDLPARHAGHLTFGCFNVRSKINPPLLELWSHILAAVPGSRLLLKNRSLLEASARQQLQGALEAAGIDIERVELAGHSPTLGGHLATYGRVDIALDTFPYHGTTTTCEALWMGVPVVTLAGTPHVSRVGVSLLNNAGLPEMVAASPDQYVQLASDLAANLPRLGLLRSTLRQRMEGSPLMDAPRFTRDMEAAYRDMWLKWCQVEQ